MPAKLTIGEVDATCAKAGVRRTGDFMGSRYRLECVCLNPLCEDAGGVTPIYDHMQQGGPGCKYCSPRAVKKLTVDDADAACSNAGQERIGAYVKSTNPLLCVCLTCGVVTTPTVANMRASKSGCNHFKGRVLASGGKARCIKCGEVKGLDAFNKNANARSGHRLDCRKCQKLRKKKYRADNREAIARYRALNREQAVETLAKWHAANPEQRKRGRKNDKHLRRGREAANEAFPVTSREVAAIVAGSCFACGVTGPSTIGHIVPIARGGGHRIGNLISQCLPCNSSQNAMLWIEWKYSDRPQALKVFGGASSD